MFAATMIRGVLMGKRTRKFKTEVQQLLDLVIHSLYSKKEVFLRELISNASDAIDRLRFESLTDESLLSGDDEWRIKIVPDTDNRTLTVSDNGIGMTADEVEKNIGTIANSGTRKYLEKLKAGNNKTDLELIGQFGVGFYASFMVADHVTVVTRHAGEGHTAVRWISSGAGSYTLEEAERDDHGTDVILHLSDSMDEFLQEWTIRSTVTEYSDYIAYPIVMDVVRESKDADDEDAEPSENTVEEVTLNSMKAIWRRPRKEVKKSEYNEFYTHITHDHSEPAKVIHIPAEGKTEFHALMYIPAKPPMDSFFQEHRSLLHLYVKNVFINDDCKDLLPEYLRFVKGVVDSSDLPLNISRDVLQDHAVIRQIRKTLVGKILTALADMKKKKADDYLAFYQNFGRVLKEGLQSDFENHDKLKDLLLFPSTRTETGKMISLGDYVDRMPDSQKDIYYLTAENFEAAQHSPHLEIFEDKDYEVLFFVDSIDEWVADRLSEYKGKPLKAIHRGDISFDEDEKKKTDTEKKTKESEELLAFIQKQLEEDVQEVRFSSRLTNSACCLVSAENAITPTMERLMRAMNQDVPKTKRILEINQTHPLIVQFQKLFENNKEDPRVDGYIELLHGQALLMEGTPLTRPRQFAKLVCELMVSSVDKS